MQVGSLFFFFFFQWAKGKNTKMWKGTMLIQLVRKLSEWLALNNSFGSVGLGTPFISKKKIFKLIQEGHFEIIQEPSKHNWVSRWISASLNLLLILVEHLTATLSVGSSWCTIYFLSKFTEFHSEFELVSFSWAWTRDVDFDRETSCYKGHCIAKQRTWTSLQSGVPCPQTLTNTLKHPFVKYMCIFICVGLTAIKPTT